MKKLPMNLPHRLTLARIAMIPVYFLLLLGGPVLRIAAALVFAAASITDYFDGKIAREQHIVTDFGKFMDPIADKLLVLLPFIYFVALESPWEWNVLPVLVMVAREMVVSGFRLVAASRGSVIAADQSGKIKTGVQMGTAIGLTLAPALAPLLPPITALCWIFTWICGALSAYSGAELLIKNWKILLVEEE